jgi:outer membrane receptor protein involved in Fe transport
VRRAAAPWRAIAVAAALLLGLPSGARAQLQLSTVTIVLISERGEPIPASEVTLNDPLGAEVQRARTDAAGRAAFAGVAPGRYEFRGELASGFPFALPVVVAGAVPMEVTLRQPAAVTDRVSVEGRIAAEPSSRGTIAGDSLARLPVRVRGRGVQDALATMPGWSTEDNGLVHARGVDDGFLYVIDGVPVYERLDALNGFAPDLSSVAAMSVTTGYVPPEFGHKAGGVIEIRSTQAGEWSAMGDGSVGTETSRDGSLSLGGPLARSTGIRVGVSSARSDRFLDPVDPDNFHNAGLQTNLFGQLSWSSGGRDLLTSGWGAGRGHYDVPNTIAQDDAGQDQRQRIGQGFVHGTWQRTWSSALVTQAAAYYRRGTARLDGSAFDTPIAASADRQLARTGALFAATRQFSSHLVKIGFELQRLGIDEAFAFHVTDAEAAEEAGFRDEVLDYTAAEPFAFEGESTPTLWSFFAQDSWQAGSRVTLSGGLRYDSSRLLLERSQWSPRVGAAVRVNDGTVLRAAASRFFQPPQPENLLLSSSPEARVLSSITVGDHEGGADLEPERQWAAEAGVEQLVGRHLRLDLAYWYRRMEDVADPNVFAGTTVIFPNADGSSGTKRLPPFAAITTAGARADLNRMASFIDFQSNSGATSAESGCRIEYGPAPQRLTRSLAFAKYGSHRALPSAARLNHPQERATKSVSRALVPT